MRPACKRCHVLLREAVVNLQVTCPHCGRRWVVMPDGRVIHASPRWRWTDEGQTKTGDKRPLQTATNGTRDG